MKRPNSAPAPSTTLRSLATLISGYPVSVSEQVIVSFIVDSIKSGGHLPSLKLLATEGLGYSLGEINSAGGNSCNFSTFLEDKLPEVALRLLNNRGREQYLFDSGLAKEWILDAIRRANQDAADKSLVTPRNVTQKQLLADPLVGYFLKSAIGNINEALLKAGVIDHWANRDNWPNNWLELPETPLLFDQLKQKYCNYETGQWTKNSEICQWPAGVKFMQAFNYSVTQMLEHFGDDGIPANTPQNYWKNIPNCRKTLDRIVADEFPISKESKRTLLTKITQTILYIRGACSLAPQHGGIASLIIKCYPEYGFSLKEFSRATTANSFILHERLCQLGLTCSERVDFEVERPIPKFARQGNPQRVDVLLEWKLNSESDGEKLLRIFWEVQGQQHTKEDHFLARRKHKNIVERDTRKLAYANTNGVVIYLKPEDLYGPFALDHIKQRCLDQGLDLDSRVYSPIPQKTLTDYWINEKLLHFTVFTCQ